MDVVVGEGGGVGFSDLVGGHLWSSDADADVMCFGGERFVLSGDPMDCRLSL